jgi:hypothetical protein
MDRLRPALLVLSAVTAFVAASIPPMPSPVMNRQMVRIAHAHGGMRHVHADGHDDEARQHRRLAPQSCRPMPPSSTEPKPMPTSSMDEHDAKRRPARDAPFLLDARPGKSAEESTSNPSSALSADGQRHGHPLHRQCIGPASIIFVAASLRPHPQCSSRPPVGVGLFVDAGQHLDQLFDFLVSEARLEPVFMRQHRFLGDASTRCPSSVRLSVCLRPSVSDLPRTR